MKTMRLYLALALLLGLTLTQCKKKKSEDDLPVSTMSATQVAIVKNSDVQDAIADRADLELDNLADEIQSNNYLTDTTTQEKALLSTGRRYTNRTIGNRDTFDFPKIIKVDYTNYQDTTTDERFVKNGEVIIFYNASITGHDLLLITKDYYYRNFSITTDSTTISINGSRRLTRVSRSYNYNGIKSLKLRITDNITADLKYAIVKTGSTDSLQFTRKDTRVRTAALSFKNYGGNTWATRNFKKVLDEDTIKFSGTIIGTNENGESYTKTVSMSTPLVKTFYQGYPIISDGTMNLVTSGTNAAAYTIIYIQDASRPTKTLVTITDDATLKSCYIDRLFSSKMYKWW